MKIDHTNLYIGYLPPTMEDDELIRLFQPFGDIVMAKVIKDRMTGQTKGYGFVKYSDVAQANQATASMNGHRLNGRAIAVRVAGIQPQPVVPPGPPAPPAPMYPGPNHGYAGYPSQQMQSGGSLGIAPPGSYMGPPPWRPPPPPYGAYPPPPPPGSNMYGPYQGQSVPPYAMQYPPMGQTAAPDQNLANAESQQNYSAGMHSQSNTAASNNMYGHSPAEMAPNSQPTYPPSSVGYTSYYGLNPPPPAVPQSSADQQNFASAPWVVNPPVPPSVPSADHNQQTTYGSDPEYEKFMAEMK